MRFLGDAAEAEDVAQEAFLRLLDADRQVDRPAIQAKQAELLAVQGRMLDLTVTYLLEERQVLDQAQQQALFDLVRVRTGCVMKGQMTGAGRPNGRPMGHRREVQQP